MSRSRIDWEKGNRHEKAHDAVQSFAIEHSEEDPSFLEVSRSAKIKALLFEQVRRNNPEITNSSYTTKKLIYESSIQILAREVLSDTLSRCECELRIDYDFGHRNLNEIGFIVSALKARMPENNYCLLFWFECPNSVFDVVE